MRAFDNGCYFTVQLSERAVDTFKKSWPCSGLPSRSLYFQFDKRNGDLVDTNVSEDSDGAVALSHAAGRYGAQRLKLDLQNWHPYLGSENARAYNRDLAQRCAEKPFRVAPSPYRD